MPAVMRSFSGTNATRRCLIVISTVELFFGRGIQSTELTNIFPILAWNRPPDDPAVLKKMHDCGFTLAGFVPPSALDHCREAGLLAIVSDPRASTYDWTSVDAGKVRLNISNLVVEVGKHPSVYGYYLRDEPTANMFPGLGTCSPSAHRADNIHKPMDAFRLQPRGWKCLGVPYRHRLRSNRRSRLADPKRWLAARPRDNDPGLTAEQNRPE